MVHHGFHLLKLFRELDEVVGLNLSVVDSILPEVCLNVFSKALYKEKKNVKLEGGSD